MPLVVTPLVKEKKECRWSSASAWACAKAIRIGSGQLNTLIAANASDINDILKSYGVPLLDEKDEPITR